VFSLLADTASSNGEIITGRIEQADANLVRLATCRWADRD